MTLLFLMDTKYSVYVNIMAHWIMWLLWISPAMN